MEPNWSSRTVTLANQRPPIGLRSDRATHWIRKFFLPQHMSRLSFRLSMGNKYLSPQILRAECQTLSIVPTPKITWKSRVNLLRSVYIDPRAPNWAPGRNELHSSQNLHMHLVTVMSPAFWLLTISSYYLHVSNQHLPAHATLHWAITKRIKESTNYNAFSYHELDSLANITLSPDYYY